MYLNKLNENQKKLFLQLVYNAAMANGEYSKQEKEIIWSYCNEMHMSFDEKECDLDIYEIIARLASVSDEREKKIIVFEVMGLVLADYTYDESEKQFMRKLSEMFEVDLKYIDKCVVLINEYLELQKNINELVIGE